MRRLLVVCFAIGALLPLAACQREPQMQALTPAAVASATLKEEDRQMVQALRAGGNVIYFRHGATDQTQTDSDPNNLANCATQRNLTDAGRAQAQTIGTAFRTLGIPVGMVLSSEYCRALEYSRLAFTVAQPERSLDLTDPLTDQQKADSVQNVKRLSAARLRRRGDVNRNSQPIEKCARPMARVMVSAGFSTKRRSECNSSVSTA